MEFCKEITDFTITIITSVLGHASFSNTLLIAPFVFWFLRQIIIVFKNIFGAVY